MIIEKKGDLTLIIEKQCDLTLNGQTFMMRSATLGHRDGYSLKKKMRNITLNNRILIRDLNKFFKGSIRDLKFNSHPR